MAAELWSLAEIGRYLNVSAERARQVAADDPTFRAPASSSRYSRGLTAEAPRGLSHRPACLLPIVLEHSGDQCHEPLPNPADATGVVVG
jgi:hypothetical protein